MLAAGNRLQHALEYVYTYAESHAHTHIYLTSRYTTSMFSLPLLIASVCTCKHRYIAYAIYDVRMRNIQTVDTRMGTTCPLYAPGPGTSS